MAKATATCRCKECGEVFTKTKICYNRQQANEWEQWTESHCTICPACYAKAKEAEYAATHSIKEMRYSEYKVNYPDCRTVPGSYNSETKTIMVYIEKSSPAYTDKYTRAANASKSEILRAAHRLAKKLMKNAAGCSYSATFSLCLKYVYEKVREAKAYISARTAA